MNEAQPIAVVTGGSRGIGRAIVERLATDGHTVAVHFRAEKDAAEQVVADVRDRGGKAFPFAADLHDMDAASRFWQAYDIAAGAHGVTGPIAALVNNAAVSLPLRLHETTPADFERMFTVNVRSLFFLVQQATNRLVDGGRIVNVSSGGTRVAIPGYLAYSASKGALDVLTRGLAKELGPRRITVNAVAPGVVDTDMNAWWLDADGARVEAAREIALGRIGAPTDIADIVGFLVSDRGRWVTGQVIDATGGAQL